MVECSTAHHDFMLTVIVNDATNIIPNVYKMLIVPRRLFFVIVISIMIDVTKFHKIAKFPGVFEL